jgi:hypothetical protein
MNRIGRGFMVAPQQVDVFSPPGGDGRKSERPRQMWFLRITSEVTASYKL